MWLSGGVEIISTMQEGSKSVVPLHCSSRGLEWQAGYALFYSVGHLAVPYGGRQDARLEPKYIQCRREELSER
jgi:hypothetical protein